jgi:ferric-dicitrate binding protein FerR (iron transport regulator)
MNTINWELIAKHLSGNISPEEEKELIAWVKKSDENQIIFKQAKSFWKSSPQQMEFNPDTDAAWIIFKSRMLEEDKSGKVKKLNTSLPLNYWIGIAASILLVLGIGYFLLSPSSENIVAQLDEVMQTNDHLEVFYLPDSSLVWLNKNSKLSFSKDEDKRRTVFLEGEAFFEVRKDSLHPFTIHTTTTSTKVLGTSFNLKAYQYQKEVELVVASGEVEFSSKENSNKVILHKDDKAIISSETKDIIKQKNENATFLSWKEDENELRKTTLFKEERASSGRYLVNDFKWRDNFVKQTIVEGKISNSAIFTSYKNVKLKVIYYDINKNQTAVDYFTVRKSVKPGGSVDYKYRLSNWLKGTKSVDVEIAEAYTIE